MNTIYLSLRCIKQKIMIWVSFVDLHVRTQTVNWDGHSKRPWHPDKQWAARRALFCRYSENISQLNKPQYSRLNSGTRVQSREGSWNKISNKINKYFGISWRFRPSEWKLPLYWIENCINFLFTPSLTINWYFALQSSVYFPGCRTVPENQELQSVCPIIMIITIIIIIMTVFLLSVIFSRERSDEKYPHNTAAPVS